MTETLIHCPHCDAEIPVSEALAAQVRHELEATIRRESDTRQDKAVKEAEARAREALGVELKDLAHMYGDVRGLIGDSMPEIEALSLDHAASLEHKPEQ